MRVTVKIEDIEVTIDPPNSALPTLEAATAKAKELHEIKYKRFKQ